MRAGATALLFLLFAAASAWAADAPDVSVAAEVNRARLRVGEPLRLIVTVTGRDAQSASPPELPDMPFIAESTGSSSSFSWVNGRTSYTIRRDYTLVPMKEGALTIPPLGVRVGDRVYRTRPIEIAALPPEQAAPDAGGSKVIERGPEAEAARARVFLEERVDKPTAYVGEQVLYISEINYLQRFWRRPEHAVPEFTGFLVEPIPDRAPPERVKVGDRWYMQERVEFALFATKPGTFAFEAATLAWQEDPFGGSGQKQARGNPVTLEILPLPEGAPEGFSGLVGAFEIAASTKEAEAEVGKPVTVKVVVQGEGNVPAIREPARPDLSAFKLYESASSHKIYEAPGPLSGEKTFEYLLVPQAPGEAEVGPFRLSFFDPAAKAYRTVETAPLRLSVRPGAGAASAAAPVEGLAAGTDVRPLKLVGALRTSGDRTPRGALLWTLVAAPWLAAGGVLGARLLRARVIENPKVFSEQRLRAKARRELTAASKLLEEGRREDFYVELSRAVSAYLAERCGRGGASLTRAELLALLRARGGSDEALAGVARLLETCDHAKFAPGAAGGGDMREALALAEEALGRW